MIQKYWKNKMKNTNIALTIIATLSFSVHSYELLETQPVTVHGIDLTLNKILDDDGQVCVEYVRLSDEKDNGVVISIEKMCGKSVSVFDGFGKTAQYPENISSMQFDTLSQRHIINGKY